jgi:hypothetical protein
MNDPLRDALAGLPAPAADADAVTIVFRQHTASVALTTTLPAVTAAATDTLYAYTTHPAGPATWQVLIAAGPPTDPARFTQAVTNAIPRDIGPGLLAGKLTLGGSDVWWVPDRSSLIRLDPRRRLILVNCPPDSAPDWGTRLTRQAITAQHLSQGAAYAHAAAFTYNGAGVAVTGFKGAGKTTTLIAALRHLGADFVTNDRLLVRTAGDTVIGHAWPHRLHIGAATLNAYPDLALLAPLTPDTKAIVEPPDIPRILAGGTVKSGCRLAVMLWPTLTMDPPDRPTIARVPPDELRNTLTRTRCFTVDHAGQYAARINHWLLPPPGPLRDAQSLNAVAAAVAAAVPCYRLTVTADPADTATAIADALSQATTTIR